ncbi:MAG: hypothetical protein ABIT01_06415 [Thermoanaerobaculia bacterium]
MSSAQESVAPSVDLPSLSVRWEGLVVTIDANTLNTIIRKATRHVREIEDILIEPEDGRLGLSLRVRKGITLPLKGHVTSIRLKHGFLGFSVSDLTAFGVVPVWDWIIRKIIDKQPAGSAFFYPDEKVVVINLNKVIPQELSLQVSEVICEGGEVKLVFGPSQYRLDRLINEIGTDPFDNE